MQYNQDKLSQRSNESQRRTSRILFSNKSIHQVNQGTVCQPEDVCEETISPFSGVGVQHTIESLLAHGLGVNDMCHTLHSLKALQGLQQYTPGCWLARATGPHHHKTMVEVADLVQLEHLWTRVSPLATVLSSRVTCYPTKEGQITGMWVTRISLVCLKDLLGLRVPYA